MIKVGENNWTDMGGGRMATGGWISQYGSFGDKLQALGKSNAALMAGGLLAMDGLRRGGYAGLAETTAGGALIGYKFGGPIGAAIGAAAGAVAGIVRLFVKGAVEKAKDKIKALYGVDISDKGVLQQIVDMAKSGFGGNLDMAIQPPQITDADVSATQEFARTAAGILLFLEVADTCPALPKLKGAIYWLRGRWKPGFREATEP